MALDPETLRAVQEWAEPYMTTPVVIYRPVIKGEGWADVPGPSYDAQYDYGDDEWVDPTGESSDTYPVVQPASVLDASGTLRGWFFSHIQTDTSEGAAQIGTIDIHEVRLPIGTDIDTLDVLLQVPSGDRYIVIDTNAEDSYPDMLRCSLRKRQ